MLAAFILRRCLMTIPMLLAISFVSFVIIELPPGSFLELTVERPRPLRKYHKTFTFFQSPQDLAHAPKIIGFAFNRQNAKPIKHSFQSKNFEYVLFGKIIDRLLERYSKDRRV